MLPEPKLKPCRWCESTSYVRLPLVSAIAPYESLSARPGWPNVSGWSLVCVGCGHVEVFAHGLDRLKQIPGAQEVTALVEPYR